MKTDFTPEQLREKDAFVADRVFGLKIKSAFIYSSIVPNEFTTSDLILALGKEKRTLIKSSLKQAVEDGSVLVVLKGRTRRPTKYKGQFPRFCTDPTASDALDDAIFKELRGNTLCIWFRDGEYCYHSVKISVKHPDKKICRVLFAEKLWSKT